LNPPHFYPRPSGLQPSNSQPWTPHRFDPDSCAPQVKQELRDEDITKELAATQTHGHRKASSGTFKRPASASGTISRTKSTPALTKAHVKPASARSTGSKGSKKEGSRKELQPRNPPPKVRRASSPRNPPPKVRRASSGLGDDAAMSKSAAARPASAKPKSSAKKAERTAAWSDVGRDEEAEQVELEEESGIDKGGEWEGDEYYQARSTARRPPSKKDEGRGAKAARRGEAREDAGEGRERRGGERVGEGRREREERWEERLSRAEWAAEYRDGDRSEGSDGGREEWRESRKAVAKARSPKGKYYEVSPRWPMAAPPSDGRRRREQTQEEEEGYPHKFSHHSSIGDYLEPRPRHGAFDPEAERDQARRRALRKGQELDRRERLHYS
jgi:hypothetical protein